MKIAPTFLMVLALAMPAVRAQTNTIATAVTATQAPGGITEGWKEMPFKFVVQHPYDLDLKERYKFDPASNTHDFWVFFSDKPHDPPPNTTTARTEMRLESFSKGEHMFDADVNVQPGTFACIAQVFDAAHGPVTMVIAHPDGTVTVGRTTIKTDAINHWWNLKMTDDPAPSGKIKLYVNNSLAATFTSRGPREYYFKCGVYSRKNSNRSEVLYRNIKMWMRPETAG